MHVVCWLLAALQEARGGEVVVREGLLVQPPTITAQPADATVNEGATVQLTVKAVVSAAAAAAAILSAPVVRTNSASFLSCAPGVLLLLL